MKPGYRTTEFLLAMLVAAIGGVASSGLLIPGSKWAQIVGIASVALSSMFYAYTRMVLKLAHAPDGTVTDVELDEDTETAPVEQPKGITAFELLPILASFALIVGACAWLKSEAKESSQTVVDCTVVQAKKLTTELSPTFAQLLTRATGGDGKIDWPSIDDATRSLSELGWCALENTVARLVREIPLKGGPQSSPLPMGYDELMHGMAALRHKRFEGVAFKVE
jgi:hypothetical protein